MTLSGKLKILAVASIVAILGSEAANEIMDTDAFSIVTPAEARVGRPLTPVSVAGVARRTSRRCNAGVYNC